MKIRNVVLGTVVLCILGFALYSSDQGGKKSGPSPSAKPPFNESRHATKETAEARPASGKEGVQANPADMVDKDLLASLRDRYGTVIHHPGIQVQAIEELVRMLKKLYPETWQDHVQDYLAGAFPEYIDALMDHYEKLQAYTQWAEDNREALSGLPIYEIRDRIWDIRKEIFGDEALVIWAMELKQEDVNNVLGDLEERGDLPFEEKTAYYNEHLNNIYGDNAQAYIKSHQQELINMFLGVAAVQDDLEAMDGDERKARLAGLRESMGFDGGAIKRWSDLDDERDKRWAKGLAYMRDRDQILNSPGNEDRDEKLDTLRQSYFGDAMAKTIRQEEESGMYRFTRKRLYGKN